MRLWVLETLDSIEDYYSVEYFDGVFITEELAQAKADSNKKEYDDDKYCEEYQYCITEYEVGENGCISVAELNKKPEPVIEFDGFRDIAGNVVD